MSEPRVRRVAPPPEPPIRPSRFSGLLLWLCAAAGLFLAGLPFAVLSPLLAEMSMAQYELCVNLCYYLVFMVLPLALLLRRRPGMYLACRPHPISLFSMILIVSTALLGVFFFNGITVLWCMPLEALGLNVNGVSLPAADGTAGLLLNVFTVAVLPGVCEEFVFRGGLLSSLEPQGTRRAVWISALLFALLHGSVVGLPSQLLLGALIAWLVIYNHSIYAGLIYHTVHNAASVIIDYLNSVPTSLEPAAQAAPQTMFQALGGAPGVMVLIVELIFMGLLMRFALRSFRMRAMLSGIRPVEGTKKPLLRREWVVLILGAALVLILYVMDFLSMLGA